jgi:hypothetical protein
VRSAPSDVQAKECRARVALRIRLSGARQRIVLNGDLPISRNRLTSLAERADNREHDPSLTIPGTGRHRTGPMR